MPGEVFERHARAILYFSSLSQGIADPSLQYKQNRLAGDRKKKSPRKDAETPTFRASDFTYPQSRAQSSLSLNPGWATSCVTRKHRHTLLCVFRCIQSGTLFCVHPRGVWEEESAKKGGRNGDLENESFGEDGGIAQPLFAGFCIQHLFCIQQP